MSDIRLTEFGVTYDLTDTSALADSTPSSLYNKSFADISLAKTITTYPGEMTLEHNYSILNGTKNEFRDLPDDIAYFSDEMSDANGLFTNNPTIDVSFSQYHSSYALTINFVETYPLQIKVTWMRDSNIAYYGTYDVNSLIYVVAQDVELYNRIIVEVLKARPYHYVKIGSIKYGVVMEWNETNIKTASLVNEVNDIADKLAVSQLSFDVIDVTNSLNFGNSDGMHNYYQRKQSLHPYEIINDTKIPLGTFYLDKFSNSKNLGKMVAMSAIGLLNEVQFTEGEVYDGVPAGDVIDAIFETAGIDTYTVDSVTSAQLLYGSLKPQTCRNALREVLMACNSIVDTTTVDLIKICKSSRVIQSPITRNIKFSTSVAKNAYVSGVEIKYSTYELVDSTVNVQQNKEYPAGQHTITFNSPYSDIQVTYTGDGTMSDISTGTYYAKFTLSDSGIITITGKSYRATTQSTRVNRPYIEPGESENIKTFTTTLCNAETAYELANKLLKYYTQNPLKLNIKYLADGETINHLRLVDNALSNYNDYLAHFTKRSLNLTGGFIDTAEMMGDFNTQNQFLYAGNELYANNNELL